MSDTEELLTPPPPPTLRAAGGGGNGSADIADGDWACEECDNVNFAWRPSCNRCQSARPGGSAAAHAAAKKRKLGTEIGKAAAEKSRGLFSADDWQCNKCGNVNWARRQQCNVCNAPKFGEVEERTGFGGGYNDRGVVEYKERRRSDSDDEYDEFGRRKKRRNNSSGNEHEDERKKEEPPIKPTTAKVEEEEEDEEDDDDDGDLSKYDLSDWGDATPAKAKAKSTSRSRSRSESPKRK